MLFCCLSLTDFLATTMLLFRLLDFHTAFPSENAEAICFFFLLRELPGMKVHICIYMTFCFLFVRSVMYVGGEGFLYQRLEKLSKA